MTCLHIYIATVLFLYMVVAFVSNNSKIGFILFQAYKKLSLFMTILAKKIMTFL